MHWYQMKLKGSGQIHTSESQVCRPERISDIPKYMEQVGKNGIVARGLGTSYADQTLNSDGAVMMFDRLDRIRSFDESTGELICEAGITLGEITELFGSRGYMVPIATVSGNHTLGGAISSNLIGSNSFKKSYFSKCINWMDVVLSADKTVRASAKENADLFSAVIGGQGLIGFISLLSITLLKRPEENVSVVRRRFENLDELLDALRESRKTADYCTAWIDTSVRKEALIGRSVLKTATFTKEEAPVPFFGKAKRKIPLPNFMLKVMSWPWFKDIKYRMASANVTKVEPYETFLYPADSLRIESQKGVYQVRLSFSEAEGPQAIRRILMELSRTRIGTCRASLMLTKEDSVPDFSFAVRGYSLSLDFYRRKGLEEFLAHILTLAGEHKGRVSLQNDALLEGRNLLRMYKGLDTFISAKKKYDKSKKFASDLGRRLFSMEKSNEQ